MLSMNRLNTDNAKRMRDYSAHTLGGFVIFRPWQKAIYTDRNKDALMKELKAKNLPLAIGLNIVLPGLGYMYMGRPIVGLLGCLLVVGIYATSGVFGILITWLAMNALMAIDMIMLNAKRNKKVHSQDSIKCRSCAEFIKKEAKKCRFCGEAV
jgi:hypothetical protein